VKFLIIARPRPNQQGMTSEMVQATVEKVKGQLKSGVTDCIYSFADGSGSIAIANADSGDALVDLLESPAAPFLHFEAHPLADFNKVINNVITTMKKQGL
jgi:hypothetical protein